MNKRPYIWKEPKVFQGDDVLFQDHKGCPHRGRVVWIRTSYGGYENNIAYHVYSIVAEGHVRARHVGEDHIINKLNP